MAQLVARLVRNEKVGGSNPPSSTTGRHPITDVGFLFAWARSCGACCCAAWRPWCSGCRRARLLGVPVGGGPPASRPRGELRSARRLEARPGPAAAHGHRSQALLHPPASSTPAALWCCVAEVPGQAQPSPTGTAATPKSLLGARVPHSCAYDQFRVQFPP